MSTHIAKSDELIDSFFDKLALYDLLKEEKSLAPSVEFSDAQKFLQYKVEKLRSWGTKLKVIHIFSFENQEIKATPLINSITNLNSLIRTSSTKVEAYLTKKKNTKTGEMEEVVDYDTHIVAPSSCNSIEKELLKLLDLQETFLKEVVKFIECVNQLEPLEKTLVYHHYLKCKVDSLQKIQIDYMTCCSLRSIYRIREKAVISLYDKLLYEFD